jgi:V/A-type H+/Na+-transporting ATPase subunit I
MFFPEAMTEIELIIPAKDLLPVTKVLAGQGIFHQVDASYMDAEGRPESVASWKEHAAEYAALERQITVTMQALAVEEGSPPPVDQDTIVDTETVRPQVEQIEAEVKGSNDQLTAGKKHIEQQKNYISQIEPIADVDLDMGMLRDPRYIHSILGNMPTVNLERLETSLSRVPHVLLTLRKGQENSVVWLIGANFNADILERAARSAYLNPLELSETHEGTPSGIIKSLNEDIDNTQKDIEKHEAKLNELKEIHKQQLRELLWQIRASRLLADAMARFGRLHYTYLIVGWVPSSRLEGLTQKLKEVSKDIALEATPSPQRGSANNNVPVALENPGILAAFQGLTTTYARPRYEEIDPTILISLTFPLLFGAMFGDVAHGLLLALLGGLIASKTVPALRSMASLGTVVLVCGLVATLFGFIYGSIFGLENILPNVPFLRPFILIQPMESRIQILLIAIGVGVVLLSIGFLLNLINAWKARDWARLFFDPNGLVGLVLYWSLLGLGGSLALPSFPIPAPVFIVLALISGTAVTLSEVLKRLVEGHRPLIEGGIPMFAFQAFVELFEKLISLFSNSMSFVRVGAFAVAHAGLSGAIFVLAELVGGGPQSVAYWIVVVLGNIFIVGFEGLIVGIQTMRLHYYEFFSKFFVGGGIPYEPLTPLQAEK